MSTSPIPSPLPPALPRLLHTGSLSSGLFSASALGVSCSAPNLRDYVRTHHRHHHPKPPLSPGSLPCKSGMFGTFTTLSVLSHGAGLFICIHLKSFFFSWLCKVLFFFLPTLCFLLLNSSYWFLGTFFSLQIKTNQQLQYIASFLLMIFALQEWAARALVWQQRDWLCSKCWACKLEYN